jgi:hypothetical protein
MLRHLLIILFFIPVGLFAQIKTIVVRDQMNKPISGCTIFKQSVAIGVTDSNGLFTLNSSQNDLFNFRAVGYKEKSLHFENINTEVILFDSVVELHTVQIRPTRLIKTTVGNGFKTRYNIKYEVHSGGFMGTKILFNSKSFYINELNFLVHDYSLPEQNRNMKINICECPKDTKHDTVGRKIFADPIVVRLDKKRGWYNIKLDTINQYQINTNCIFVEFEMLYKPTIKEMKVHEYYIVFGMTPNSKGISTFTHDTFHPYLNGFISKWTAAHTPQKINVKLTEVLPIENPR